MQKQCKFIAYIVILFSYEMYCWFSDNQQNLAVVMVPVADASTFPLKLLDFSKSAEQLYKDLPWAPDKGDYACPRYYQLLFNEVVRVRQELNEEVECEVYNAYYITYGKKTSKVFWTLKKNLISLNKLTEKSLSSIPKPYGYEGKANNSGILTLVLPWADPISKRTYSVGTRFIRDSTSDNDVSFGIILLNSEHNKIKSQVPRKLSRITYPQVQEDAIALFIKTLKLWIHQKGFIPYVWGGNSFIDLLDDPTFSLVESYKYGEKISYWIRPEKQNPCIGFDCSSLILRASQICGLPYFLKNTGTLSTFLRQLGSNEAIEEGDLIWYEGHVLVVSDKKNNKVIEAVGYKTAFGKVHEIPIKRVFKNVSTLDALAKYYRAKKPLKRLTIAGTISKDISTFLILKMKSIFT